MLLTFSASFLFVLAIPIFIGSIAYFVAEKAIEEESIRTRISALKQAGSVLDYQFMLLRNISAQLDSNPLVRRFSEADDNLSAEDRFLLLDILREFAVYRSDNSFILDFYLYFAESDRILASEALYSPELFYPYSQSFQGISFGEWLADLRKADYRYQSMRTRALLRNQKPKPVIEFSQTLPRGDPDGPRARFVALIDAETVLGIFEPLLDGGALAILDPAGDTIFRDGASSVALEPPSPGNPVGVYEKLDGRERHLVTYFVSPETGCRYLISNPRSAFFRKLESVRRVTVLIALSCLAVGIAVSLALSYRYYLPIGSAFLSLLPGEAEKSPGKKRSDLEFIRDRVADTLSRNRQLESSLRELSEKNSDLDSMFHQNKELMKESLVAGIVKGGFEYPENANSLLKRFDMEFPYGRFIVALVHFDSAVTEQERPLVHGKIKEIASRMFGRPEISGQTFAAASLEKDLIALLFNVADEAGGEAPAAHLAAECARLVSEAKAETAAALSVGIGDPREGLPAAPESFAEAEKAIHYRVVRGRSSVVAYGEIVDLDKAYYYPIGEELQLINCLGIGDGESCAAILDRVFVRNFSDRRLDFRHVQCLFLDLASTAAKAMDSMGMLPDELPAAISDPVQAISVCGSVDEMREVVDELYAIVSERRLLAKKKEKNDELKRRILSHIEEHCADRDLSQSTVAEYFGCSYSYLSKFINKETGRSIVDHITEIRVRKAKEFLRDSSLPLEEVACRVGYNNGKTLIRVFKEREGVTPGRFREACT